ncbi:MAG: hypothetical protein IJV44_01870 [Prevotella sp.]|nr:hypothetical protein [Prevotella sp.]MBR1545805.1 hypothetical protein [Prevotella sp.]
MKTLKYIGLILGVSLAIGVTSCKEDDGDAYPGGDGPVVVNKIYLEDADANVKDRDVTEVWGRLGQTLRLEGSGFGGTQKILVNGYDTYFNTSLVTDNSMILQLQSKTPISTADPELRDKIIFIKGDKQYVKEFVIRAASPRINSFSNTLPQAGETVYAYGSNLQETSIITLPGGIEVTEIINAPEKESGEWFSFVMPEGVTEGGAIHSVGANGEANSAAYFNLKAGMLLDFDGTGSQGYWSWSETGSMINADDLVDDPLNSGHGKVCQLIPERLLTNGVAANKSRATEAWTAGAGGPTDDWSQLYEIIPEGTPVTDVAFQFDIYVPDPWNLTGNIQIALINNYNFQGIYSDEYKSTGASVAFFCPWLTMDENGKFVTTPWSTTGWKTITIPFSEFRKYYYLMNDEDAPRTPTFAEVVADREAATYQNFGMSFVNNDIKTGIKDDNDEEIVFESFATRQKIYVDNWRIVPCKITLVSDFPDEE